jgi:hypothetical protein
MSNVSLAERLEIDRRKLDGKRKKLDKLLFEVGQTEGEIRMLEARIRYCEKIAEDRADRTTESTTEQTQLFEKEE